MPFLPAVVEPECEKSSATTYYWYRAALNISSSISESGGLHWKMSICLLAAWLMVCLAMIKGIQSSGKVSVLEPPRFCSSPFLGTVPPSSSAANLWANCQSHFLLGLYYNERSGRRGGFQNVCELRRGHKLSVLE